MKMKTKLTGSVAIAFALCSAMAAASPVFAAPSQTGSAHALTSALTAAGGLPATHALRTQANITIPPVSTGLTEEEAVTQLSSLGLVVSVSTVPSSVTPKGYVDSFSLTPGTSVPYGTAITIFLSSGPVKTNFTTYNVQSVTDLDNAITAINANPSGDVTLSTINVINNFIIDRKFDVKYDTQFNLGSNTVSVHIPSPTGTFSETDLTAFNIINGAAFEIVGDPGCEFKVETSTSVSATEAITASTLVQVNGSKSDPSQVSRLVVNDPDVKLTLTKTARGSYCVRSEYGLVEFKDGEVDVQGRGTGIFNHEGTVTVSGGNFNHTSGYDETIYASGITDDGAYSGYCLLNGGGSLDITGGTFTVEAPPIPTEAATKLAAAGLPSTTTIPLSTNNFQALTKAGCVANGVGSNTYGRDGTVNITGGTFVSKNPNQPAVYSETGAFNMAGGSITGAQWGVEIAGTSSGMQAKFIGGEVHATGATYVHVPNVNAMTADDETKKAGQAVYVTDDSIETRADVVFSGGTFVSADVKNAPAATYPQYKDLGHAVLLGHRKTGPQASISAVKIEGGTFYGLVDIRDDIYALTDPRLNISLEGGVYYNVSVLNGAPAPPIPPATTQPNTPLYAIPDTVTPTPTGYDKTRYDRFVRFVRTGYNIVDWTTALGGDNIAKTVMIDPTSAVASITVTTGSGSVVVTKYATLQQAFAAAPVNGVVELLRDVEIDTSVAGGVVINNNSVRLNLNSKKLTLIVPTSTSTGIDVNNTSHFTITDEAGSYGQVVVRGPGVGIRNRGGSATTVLRGNYELEAGYTGGTIIGNEGGTVKISGGSFLVADSSSIAGTAVANNPATGSYASQLQIEGGVFTSNSTGMAPVRVLDGTLEIAAAGTTTGASFTGVGNALQILGGTADIMGGDFEASKSTGRALAVTDDESAARVRVTGGTFRGGRSLYVGVTDPAVPIVTKVSVTGGTFYGAVDGTSNVNASTGVIDIAGGVFYTTDGTAGYNPNATHFIRPGYMTVDADDNVGRKVVMDKSKVVCEIGDEGFLTIADAVDSIKTGTSPKVITLVKDTTITEAVQIDTKRATLNLNCHTITVNLNPSAGTPADRCGFNVTGGSTATLNITNSAGTSAGSTGKIVVMGDASGVHVEKKSNFTMTGGEIEITSSNGGYAVNNESGNAVISGGKFVASFSGASTRSDGMGPGCFYNGPTTTTAFASARITGGQFVSSCTSGFACVSEGGTFAMSGTMSVTGVYGGMLFNGGSPTVQAGSFTATSSTGTAFMVTDDQNAAVARILGGTFKGYNALYMGTRQTGKTNVACTTQVNGGTFYGYVGVQTGVTYPANGFLLSGGTYYATDGLSGKFPNSSYVATGYQAVQSSGVGVIIAKVIDASNTIITLPGFGTRIYNGQVQVPTSSQIAVTVGGKLLEAGTDYSYTFTGDTVNAGEVVVVITGKGAYTGVATTSYQINRKDINTVSDVQLDKTVYDYVPGGVQPTVVSVKDGSILVAGLPKVLVEGVDYGVSAATANKAGTGAINLIGIGNYTGVMVRQFTVLPRDLGTVIAGEYAVNIATLPDQVYSGSPLYATTLNVRDGDYTLNPGTDYTVTYAPTTPVNVGTVTVTVKGIGNYSGTRTATYDIVPRNISGTSSGIVVAPIADQSYTGSAIEPLPQVRFGNSVVLTKDVDYTVSWSNNIAAGTHTGLVTVTGIGNFEGTQTALFSIVDPSGSKLRIDTIADQVWTGSAIEPSLRVTVDGVELASGLYDVSYADNVNVGQAIATVKLKSNYPSSGAPLAMAGEEARVGFRITAKSARDVVVNPIDNQPYTGLPIEPPITVHDGSYNLIKDRDYELVYPGDHTNVGQSQVIVRFINGYVGNERTVTFNIVRNIGSANVTVSPIPDQWWTGTAITPTVTVVDNDTGQTLVEGVHYGIAHLNNVHVGLDTGQVRITGIGDYFGSSRVETFTILGSLLDANISLKNNKPAASYTVSDVRVTHGGKLLTFVQDYTANVSASGNVVTVVAVGQGLFAGTTSKKTARFQIDPVTHDVTPLDPTAPEPTTPDSPVEPGVELRTVPDLLTGMTAEQARNALALVDLTWQITYQNSSTVSPGFVMRQSEDPFTQVPKGTKVTITISLGLEGGTASEMVLVPNVMGMVESGARYALESRGLGVTVVSMSSNTVPQGQVMGQSVAAGTSVGKGSNVTITVSIGTSGGGSYVTVPNVEGDTEAVATQKLKDCGLVVRRNSASSTTVEEGLVMGQSVKAGSSVSSGAVVWITVSLGGGSEQGGSTGGGGTGGTVPYTPSTPSTPGTATTPDTPTKPEKEIVGTIAIPQGTNDTAAAVKRLYSDGTSDVYITSFTGGTPAEGWQIVNNNWYFAYEQGKAVTGLLDYNGDVYLMNEDGEIVTGFATDPATGERIYLEEEHNGKFGVMAENTWLEKNGGWYHAASDGTIETGLTEVDNLQYYFDGDGKLQVGWFYSTEAGEWMYGSTASDETWGSIVKNSWVWDGAWYFLGNSGTITTGWMSDGGKWYYFNPTSSTGHGEMMSGWVYSYDTWYRLGDDGAMQTGWTWDESAGKWAYLSPSSGAMQTGWFFADGDGWYLADGSGYMKTGWQFEGGNWYYLGGDGRMRTGWVWDNGWYYLDGSGKLLANTWTPDGYWLGMDGKLVA